MNTPARDRLIQTTALLLQTQGYNSTGLNQVLQESGVPKGSLYHYFPGGKEDLAIAAIEQSALAVQSALQAIVGRHSGLPDSVSAAIDYFIGELESSQFSKGCPVATIALEQAGINARIQAACQRAYAAWQAALIALFETHGTPNAEQLADRLLMALEGGLILSRARRDCKALRQIKSELPIYLC
ncbi:TetR/AcrR family transcriptional regulator [Undibacterium sp.]|jgi:TetR/AcrR family transcriptional repressor of lmrAB and yxaGH operons|uniref:TetR/AcrR family transcriptional regulator n=1 Tax=Undibacterium sp. TaxID=1914977 RepID=UPI002B713ABF|nr:TetR/AcrR family transcriptional regulator [Undibacterium sp.]HTD04053.1 TetR/AcrR family transcriptional regulator [Undibacterium sp.]